MPSQLKGHLFLYIFVVMTLSWHFLFCLPAPTSCISEGHTKIFLYCTSKSMYVLATLKCTTLLQPCYHFATV